MFAEVVMASLVVFGQSVSNYISKQAIDLKYSIRAAIAVDATSDKDRIHLYAFGCTASGVLILATGSVLIASFAWMPSIMHLS